VGAQEAEAQFNNSHTFRVPPSERTTSTAPAWQLPTRATLPVRKPFEQALQISPGYAPAVINLMNTRAIIANENGVQAFKAGNYARAVSFFEQALRINPNDAMAANNLRTARAGLNNGATTSPTPNVNAATNPKEARATALREEGNKAMEAHNYVLAVKLYEQAVQLMGPNADIHIGDIVVRGRICGTRGSR
jgi:tetratricopeptide (TPR) repeat protein